MKVNRVVCVPGKCAVVSSVLVVLKLHHVELGLVETAGLQEDDKRQEEFSPA